MACGTPVIGANVGGIKYSIQDGKTGFLVPPKDPMALAKKIEQLITDKQMMKVMKQNAIKHVNNFFTWTNVADIINSIYEKVVISHQNQAPAGKLISLPEFSLKHVENILQKSFLPKLNTQ